LLLFTTAGAADAASPAQALSVKLQDSSTDPSIAHMHLVVESGALKPGRVTIQAENQSKTLVHESSSCGFRGEGTALRYQQNV
jgi:hypothetical protein